MARPQVVVLRTKSGHRISPSRNGVEPYRTLDEFGRLPLIARPDVSVKKVVRVAEELQVHAPERWIVLYSRSLHGFAGKSQALQVRTPLSPVQVRQPPGTGVVGQQNAVTRQPLRVTHDGEAAGQPSQHRWVLTTKGGANAVLLPVGHPPTLAPPIAHMR